MKLVTYSALFLVTVWLHMTLGITLKVGQAQPNLLLLTVLVLGLRWVDPWIFLFGAAAGLAQDGFSHGMLGVYGISYTLVSIAAWYVGNTAYENTLTFTGFGVLLLCLAEGLISVSLLFLIDQSAPAIEWYLGRIVPTAVYTALLSPGWTLLLDRLQRVLKPLP